MKKIWLLIAAVAIVSCKNEAPIKYAVLTGKITNKLPGEFTVNSMDRSFKETIEIAEDGSFVDTLTLKAGTYMLYDGKNATPVYLSEGFNVNVAYDANDFKNTLAFTGEGSEISNYLQAKSKTEKEIMGEGMGVYELEEDEYKAKFNEIKTALNNLLTSTEGISEEFKSKEQRNINYGYLKSINIYERYHAHFAKKPEFKVSEGFLAELDGMDYSNEEDFLFSSDYKNLVSSHYFKQASKLAEKDSIDADLAFLKTAAQIQGETIKNSLLFENAKYGITYTENLEEYYTAFINASTNEDNKKEITETYNKLKVVAKGQPSPKFENYENYAGGTTSLDDLKGKFVYVDVWATWCGPCKAEIPYLKEVEAKYHDKNIEFVSISIDKAADHDKWKTMVEEKELKGVQLFADNDWNSQFVKDYLIKGIPRFILIDTEGNIVSSNAPRPSSPKLISLFNELNI
ncbi:TlpA family protein disulfide reductase [Lutibacter aestuarii]|uniref:TlpA family protein disulfide reductase n=1 Tax=Lutibacter aestuarii TaxID=861111 RepID=A0ABW2Z4T3_9FLAO|nr:TlpA disulfide reductase family protein [uncultured Lutibacter sp.]